MAQSLNTPRSLGYRMPAEWEKHAATWLSWPCNAETWESHLTGAEQAFTEMIEALTPHETVNLLVPDEDVKARAFKKLRNSKAVMSRLNVFDIDAGDIWFRDYGPTFVVKDTPHDVAWTKWTYNAYGNKYDDLLIGNEVPDKMPIDHTKRFDSGIVLEGGSIDVNGTGTVLTTESCLLSPDRNPNLTKLGIEQKLKDYIGVTNILWLSAGIEGDDTTGHVDDITRFVNRNTVVTVVEDNPNDPNYAPLQENLERLKKMKIENGELLNVITLPMPKEFIVDDRRMAASYANFYIANNVILLPTYNQPTDKVAHTTLQKCFPDRTIVDIDCCELIWGYGSIHCATQQEPA